MNFRQANLDAFAGILEQVASHVPVDSVVCELYAGVGLIGLSIAHKCAEVRCSDENPANVRAFEKACRSLPSGVGGRASYVALSAADALDDGEAEGANVVIVDPPRKGLGPEVLACLCDPFDERSSSLERLIYVSCGFDALNRELPELRAAGWEVIHSEGHVLFPGSDHIETLVVADRSPQQS